MERNVKHLLLRKTDVLKTSIFSENMKKCTNFEEYIRRNVYIGIIVFSCPLPTKPCLRFHLNRFVREIKGFFKVPSEMRLISGT